jgi:hypothetical protein
MVDLVSVDSFPDNAASFIEAVSSRDDIEAPFRGRHGFRLQFATSLLEIDETLLEIDETLLGIDETLLVVRGTFLRVTLSFSVIQLSLPLSIVGTDPFLFQLCSKALDDPEHPKWTEDAALGLVSLWKLGKYRQFSGNAYVDQAMAFTSYGYSGKSPEAAALKDCVVSKGRVAAAISYTWVWEPSKPRQ